MYSGVYRTCNRPVLWGLAPPIESKKRLSSMNENQFRPLPNRGLHWIDQNALLVADLHLGKEATFCHEGIAVPRGASERTLEVIADMLQTTAASHLMILGDLFHAKSSLADDMKAMFANFLMNIGSVQVLLIKGNHDQNVGTLPTHWLMQVVESPYVLRGIELSHFPDQAAAECSLRIAGHVHPAVRLRGSGHAEGKLACFHYDAQRRCLTLPAAGAFTGTKQIQPTGQDRVWVVSDNEVIEVKRRHIV